MSQKPTRSTETLESAEENADAKVEVSPQPEPLISMNYPRPTLVSKIVNDVAGWSEFSIILEPNLNQQIQIFAPSPLPRSEAFQLFVASIESVGLRIIHLNGRMLKVARSNIGKISA